MSGGFLCGSKLGKGISVCGERLGSVGFCYIFTRDLAVLLWKCANGSDVRVIEPMEIQAFAHPFVLPRPITFAAHVCAADVDKNSVFHFRPRKSNFLCLLSR